MKGSEFVAQFGPKGLPAWEGAAFDLAKQGQMLDWGWTELALSDGQHSAIVRVQNDVFAVGEADDFVRLPLLPKTAQDIANLYGYLLPTPWLVYKTWQAASIKLTPTAMVPNKGANLGQYAEHNAVIETARGGRSGLVDGHKKSVIVSNIYKPGKVLIFGWYRPEPDVYDDGTAMGRTGRQPTQPKSNVHGDFYVDYSHGIRFYHPICTVDGQDTDLASLYQDPVLSKLVSNEGPVKVPRYPSSVAPARGPASTFVGPVAVATEPSYATMGLAKVVQDYVAKQKL